MADHLTENLSVLAINSSESDNEDEFPFENFAPTLAQCYFIVFAGLFFAKADILSSSDVRGVNAFASFVAMPAIICVSIADADLPNLQWELLLGIAMGKAIVYAAVAAAVVTLTKPAGGAAAGIYAMFSVQCNDLPVGNPLMSSLYRYDRPYMMKYLFFVPAITLILFSPVTYLMTERYRQKSAVCTASDDSERLSKKFLGFLKGNVATSPVVIATLLGICLNLIFKAKVPPSIHHPIHVLAATIPGIALCNLGFTICGKERFVFSSSIVLAIILVFVKMVFTPLILHSVVKSLSHGSASCKELSDFALLYGIISPSAIIFQTAQEYKVKIAAMSAALILSSLTCFPLSYFIARLTIVKTLDFKMFIPAIRYVFFYASCLSLIACAYTLGSFVRDKHWKKKPHICVAYLMFCQVLVGASLVAWGIKGAFTRFTECLFIGGEVSADLWIATMFTSIALHKKYPELLKNHVFLLMGTSLGISTILTILHGILAKKYEENLRMMLGVSHTSFDHVQMVVTTVVLSFSLVAVCCGMVKHYRRHNNHSRKSFGIYNISFAAEESRQSQKTFSGDFSKSPPSLFGEDQISSYYCSVVGDERKLDHLLFGAVWTRRIFSLLQLISLIMTVRLALKTLKLLGITENAIMVPMELLHASLFAGQGVISWFTFGVDLRTTSISVRKWFKVLLRKENKSFESEEEQLSNFRSAFEKDHYSLCFASLAGEKEWKERYYSNAFWGHQLVDWLLSNSLASDRRQAEGYGQSLLRSNVIRHVNEAHQFYDAPYLYHFTK